MKNLEFRNKVEDIKADFEEMAWELLQEEREEGVGYWRSEALHDKRISLEVDIEEIDYYLKTDLTIENIEEMYWNVSAKELLSLINEYLKPYEEAAAAKEKGAA